ncbi:unnamed protein product [Ranitomeya imitator]|uniref:Uncharacterized protein n=1 Tax=Ranitomeya imitator TaxID=111125 RepID=A0ABN9L098_9NEOB|nr:unnamed protein product [Ranitomeya imitator]
MAQMVSLLCTMDTLSPQKSPLKMSWRPSTSMHLLKMSIRLSCLLKTTVTFNSRRKLLII